MTINHLPVSLDLGSSNNGNKAKKLIQKISSGTKPDIKGFFVFHSKYITNIFINSFTQRTAKYVINK